MIDSGVTPLRIMVVDDHPVVREGLISVLTTDDSIHLVSEAESGEGAIVETERTRPQVVVMDVRLPGMSGLDAGKELLARYPSIGLIILTSFPTDGVVRSALAMGARGVLPKDSNPKSLREAVRVVGSGGTFVDEHLRARISPGLIGRRVAQPFGLTKMELRVLELLTQGLPNKEIAERLGISLATVKTHLSHLLKKMGVRNRAGAAAIAMRDGLG